MSGSIACPYKILGVSNLAENDEIEQAFEVYKQAYELLTDGEKRGAHDRQAANEKEKVKNNFKINVFIKFLFFFFSGFSAQDWAAWKEAEREEGKLKRMCKNR